MLSVCGVAHLAHRGLLSILGQIADRSRCPLGCIQKDLSSQPFARRECRSKRRGVLGLCAGVGLAYLVAQFFELRTIIRPWSPLLAFAISVCVGLIFGLYPARRAALMDPVEALRHE
jgi:putative ABC transport system permease protein